MVTFSLVPYSFRVRQRGQDREFFDLNDIFGHTIKDLLNRFLDENRDRFFENREHGFMRVEFYNRNENSGRILYGKNGLGSSVVDVNRNTENYRITPQEATINPYYFLIDSNFNADRGIVIIQKIGNLSIKSIFQEAFSTYLRNNVRSDLTFILNHLVPPNVILRYLESNRIIQIKLIRNHIPRDLADSLGGENEILEGQCEYIIKQTRSFSLSDHSCRFQERLRRLLNDDNDLNFKQLIEVENFQYDSIKLDVRNDNGRTKIIDIQNPDSINYCDDISDINLDDDHHPVYNMLNIRANQFLHQLI
jgi:hypothetical protein